jgi:cell division protein FtsA
MLPVPQVGEDEHAIAKVPRAMLVNIIRPRLEETFELVRDRIAAAGLGREAESRVVLTGGASQMIGARDLAQRIFNRPVRTGRPAPLRGLPDSANAAPFAVAAGLLAWGAGHGRALPDLDLEVRPAGRFRRFVHWLKDRV